MLSRNAKNKECSVHYIYRAALLVVQLLISCAYESILYSLIRLWSDVRLIIGVTIGLNRERLQLISCAYGWILPLSFVPISINKLPVGKAPVFGSELRSKSKTQKLLTQEKYSAKEV